MILDFIFSEKVLTLKRTEMIRMHTVALRIPVSDFIYKYNSYVKIAQ